MSDRAGCCEHPQSEHSQERGLYATDSKREVCMMCPGYECPGYPHGAAWHRFKPAPAPVQEQRGEQAQ